MTGFSPFGAFLGDTTTMAKVSLIGMSGSLRAGSFSNAILATLRDHFADRADLTVYDLAPIPSYNQDFEGEKRPSAVKRMLADIEAADGLVLCAPEFNHSIPGVLKNAIDWASRPAFASVLVAPSGKPTTVQTFTPVPASSFATAGTQYPFTQTLANLWSRASRQSCRMSARVASGRSRV